MPRRARKVPAYCLHKASGRAVVRLDGRDVYLGVYGEPASYEAYERAIAQWRCSPPLQPLPAPTSMAGARRLTVNEVLLQYLEHARTYYVDEQGRPSKEFTAMRYAGRPLRQLYGSTYIDDFGPLALKTIQHSLVGQGELSRQEINRRVNRMRRIIKWAVSEQLAPASLIAALQTVPPLRRGRTEAREAPPIGTAPEESVQAVLDVAAPPVAAMVRLQCLTGMRPGEVVIMRPMDIVRDGDVWVYQPARHKNQWRGHAREIYLGPAAQAAIAPYLDRDDEAYLFSPQEAEQWRSQERRRRRQTPMTPSQQARQRAKRPRRPKRNRYDVDSYRRAIDYAVKRINRQRLKEGAAAMPSWSPLQLRHSRGTEIRRKFGLEGSQVVLGHKHADITEVYAERDRSLAIRIARELG